MLARLARMPWTFKLGIPVAIAFGLWWAVKEYNMQTERAPVARAALQNAVAVDASVTRVTTTFTTSRRGETSVSHTAIYRFRDRDGREWTGSVSARPEETANWAHPDRGNALRDDARIAIIYNAIDPRVNGRRSLFEEQARMSWLSVAFFFAAGMMIGLVFTAVFHSLLAGFGLAVSRR